MRKVCALLAIFVSILCGCTSFGTAHQSFIKSMNNIIAGNIWGSQQDYRGKFVSIEQLSLPNYSPGTAEKDDLVSIEKLDNGNNEYHYAKPNLWGRHCYYYLVVEKVTNKVIGWGFDYEKSDPKKNCGISG